MQCKLKECLISVATHQTQHLHRKVQSSIIYISLMYRRGCLHTPCHCRLYCHGRWTFDYFSVPDNCNASPSPCKQDCTPSDAAPYFVCSCSTGYQLNSDGRSCTGEHAITVLASFIIVLASFGHCVCITSLTASLSPQDTPTILTQISSSTQIL